MTFRLIRITSFFAVAFLFLFLAACNQQQEPAPTPMSDAAPAVVVNNEAPVVSEPLPAAVEEPAAPVEVSEAVQAEPVPEEIVGAETAVPTPGSTVQHQVQMGEWLMQIARCYGADYGTVRRANASIWFPDFIAPGTTVTVPDVGSVGAIHGAPCVADYVVNDGDTWSELAARFGTTAVILQRVNPGPLLAGNKIIVPADGAAAAESPSLEQPPQTETQPVTEPNNSTAVMMPEPERIQFGAGESSATVGGNVLAQGQTPYVFGAQQGQSYKISLASSQDDVTFTLVRSLQEGAVLPAEGIFPAAGDYFLLVNGGAVDATFLLELLIEDAVQESGTTTLSPARPRINFAPGVTSAMVVGSVRAGETTHYVFSAGEGQRLTVQLIDNPDLAYKIFTPGPASQLQSDILPVSGDYIIEVMGGAEDEAFTMALSITNP